MHPMNPLFHSRRAFLRRSAQLAFTGVALPTALSLAAMGEAAAFDATDYKALVCVFLYGGNDHANTVVPYDLASHSRYAAIRTDIALPRNALTASRLVPAVPRSDGLQFALHPAMTGLAGLFNAGHAAVQFNVGPLIEPLTRAQYEAGSARVPPKLFSHNDQQSFWQSAAPEGATTGWGGQIGDLALSANANTLFTCMSVTGNTVFLSGDTALSYQVGAGGPVHIEGLNGWIYGSDAVGRAAAQIVQATRRHHLENAYNAVTRRAITAETALNAVLAQNPADSAAFAPLYGIANQSLARQLLMVARLIAGRHTLGLKRQVFFVSLGAFDHHGGLMASHADLMGQVSDAMTGFYNATAALGVSQAVTAFTASEFGRTLTSNGDGSDHGWGGHHLVVGGAVQGGFYGSPPPVSVGDDLGNPDDQWHVGQGRLLPSTATDQYTATLARWFGVAPGEMGPIAPNLGHFGGAAYPVNLGFLG